MNGKRPGEATDSTRLLTRADLSERLQLSKRTISRMLSAGELPPPVRIGRLVRFRESDIAKLIDRLIDQDSNAHYNEPTTSEKIPAIYRKQ